MSDIFVRAYTDNRPEFKYKEPDYHNPNITLVLDTETTIDQYQNLTFGSCLIRTKISTGFKEDWYLYYGDIQDDKRKIIEVYGSKNNIQVMSVRDFVDNLFYPYAFRMRAEVIGFNLPFDLSRLAISYGISRKTKDGFSLKLSEDVRNPRIRIQSIDQKRSFISFARPLRKASDKRYRHYSGYFVDLKTLTFALTDRSHSLDSACSDFNVSRKTRIEQHGKINEKYIDYNINDVRITSELYQSALKRYEMFNLSNPVNKLYSPATIGKGYLNKMGIKPFMECNPDFPKDVLGFVMSSYYGGRTEVRIRNKPVRVSYLDFTSMYPTVYSLLNLDRFLKSAKLKVKENVIAVSEFVNSLKIEDLRNPEIWHKSEMHSIVKVKPNSDILPVRMEYSRLTKNIGINYLTSDKELWYTIEDIIASKILTGKTPEIIQAFTFYPERKQSHLKNVKISDIEVNSSDDFIRKVIEERIRVKKSNRLDKDQIQLILKIIANATSYGFYIEENAETLENPLDVNVYSVDQFPFRTERVEKQGSYFNPIMATLITGSARLILALAENIAESNGYFAYCDTDSIFVNPDSVKYIQEFFRPLNPYSMNVEMFKIEEDERKNPLNNIIFYGISAKRYCLYRTVNGKKEILKYSTHGLGHLKDIEGKQIWRDILNNRFENYSEKMAVSQITVSKPLILNRFKKMNQNKALNKQIKPFNFILVGSEKNDVIPTLPFSKETRGIQYKEFIDYRTGKSSIELPFSSKEYWKSLEDVLTAYVRHNDNKFDYLDNKAQRKQVFSDRIRYIGKESNNIDEVSVFGVSNDSYLEYQNKEAFIQWTLTLKPNVVKTLGISERGLRNFKQKVRNGKGLRNRSKIHRILIKSFNGSNLPDKDLEVQANS
jgi:hypothetical protein